MCKFIYTTRDPYQEYVSLLSRRVICSFEELVQINKNYENSLDAFLKESGMPCYKATFEDFLLNPIKFMNRLNNLLDLDITIDDLYSVYRGKLGRKKYKTLSFYKARLLYIFFRHIRNEYLKFPIQESLLD
jgi:hypothetical protein